MRLARIRKAVARLYGRPGKQKSKAPKARAVKAPKLEQVRAEEPVTPYETRVAKLQRPEADYLQSYWQAYTAPRFCEATAIIAALAPGPRICLLDFGCGAGGLLRALTENLGSSFDLSLVGADGDSRALAFLAEQLPAVRTIEADPLQLRELGLTERFDFCTATSVCYALNPRSLEFLLDEMARLADLVVIADQIENLDGAAAVKMDLIDCAGRPYKSRCHPFRRLLRERGFKDIAVIPTKQPVKSITGFIVASKRGPLPADFAECVRRMADYRRYDCLREPVPRCSAFALRPEYDASGLQIERLPAVAIAPGQLYVGSELIGDRGFKLSAEIPRGGCVSFEVDEGDGPRLSAPMQWERPSLDSTQDNFQSRDVFGNKQYAPGGFAHSQWGSWGYSYAQEGRMVVQLHPGMDIDANQADGMGPLDLIAYCYPHADLRDATVEIELRGVGFESGDSDVFLWFQNSVGLDALGLSSARFNGLSANYALTSQPLTSRMRDGRWHSVPMRLSNRPEDWSFAGNVFADREGAVRYSYVPLDQTLSYVANLHLLACYPRAVPNYLNKRDPTPYGVRPRGAIEIRRVRFHNSDGPRFASCDQLLSPQHSSARYRIRTEAPGVPAAVTEWAEVSLPQDRRPVVSRLDVDAEAGTVAGRINAMGSRSWCWIETESASWRQLYLGATKHGRDFVYRALPGIGGRFIVANEAGGWSFPLSDIGRQS